jgi:hypothetical protein
MQHGYRNKVHQSIAFMKTITLILALGAFSVVSATAAPLNSEKDARNLADQFMTLIGKGTYRDAFALMKPNWPMPESELNDLAYQTDSQLKLAPDRFGKLLGQEFIQANHIGKSFVRFVYIQKFENHATRWMIVFYHPANEWKIDAITWDEKPQELFDMKGEQGGSSGNLP